MKILPLSIELAELAIAASENQTSAPALLQQVERMLSCQAALLGNFTGKKWSTQRDLGGGLHAQDFRLDYEHRSLQFQLVRLRQRGGWEVKGFRFV